VNELRLRLEPTSALEVGVGGGFPDKADGEHRWAAVVTFPVSSPDAGLIREGATVVVDANDHVLAALGCVDCRKPYDVARLTRCTAPPFGDPRP
jgi:hypothetical protein